MSVDPVFVVAGSWTQARDWAALRGINPARLRMIRSSQDCQGVSDIDVYKIGTYYQDRLWLDTRLSLVSRRVNFLSEDAEVKR